MPTTKASSHSNFQLNLTAKLPLFPSELYIKSATLNPAIALAATEHTESQLSQVAASNDEPHYSRLGLETILGTLAGAALGANLYLLLAYVNRQQN